jgi:hypothetical protein
MQQKASFVHRVRQQELTLWLVSSIGLARNEQTLSLAATASGRTTSENLTHTRNINKEHFDVIWPQADASNSPGNYFMHRVSAARNKPVNSKHRKQVSIQESP